MKKLILGLSAVALMAVSGYSQGNVLVAGGTRGVWNLTSGTPLLNNQMNVGILFGSTSFTPLISGMSGTGLSSSGIGTGVYTPTNAVATFSISNAWNNILNDANFTFLQGTNSPSAPLVAGVNANGSITYNASTAFSAGNVNAGTTYRFLLVGWSNAYATAAAAAAAGGAVGWSQYFTYTPSSGINTPNGGVGMSTLINPFGVNPAPVPEPGTFALAGLGGLALLALRRKK